MDSSGVPNACKEKVGVSGMIRLMIMYNLAPGADEGAYLEWRLSEHQAANEAMPGVLRTDFGRVSGLAGDSAFHFKFVSSFEWPDMASFEAAFYDAEVQKKLAENLKRLGNYEFSVTETMSCWIMREAEKL